MSTLLRRLAVFGALALVGCSTSTPSDELATDATNPDTTIINPTTAAPTTSTTTTVAPTTTLPPVVLDGFQFGYAVSSSFLDDPRYTEVLAREATILTVENAMKWETIHPARGVYEFGEADRIVELAQANGQKVRGHTLIWDRQLADWVNTGEWDRESLIEVMRSHIQRVVKHYAEKFPGVVTQWDVVNEAFTSTGERQSSVWQEVIGDDYIELAFRFAHEADPNALLFYNDYFDAGIIGFDDPQLLDRGASAARSSCAEVPKCAAVADLAQQFVDDGVPLDGIGFEGHIFDLEPTDYGDFASWTLPLGLQWALTEIDVALPAERADDPDLLERQAAAYSSMIDACWSSSNCNTVVVWGVTDDQSWIPGATDDRLGHAVLYDSQFEPKPATAAVLARVAEAAS